ncbi:MAG: prepilin peptidase [Deltaproteobacteria bacterium]|nr:prepilin peptidase [Deltaproteobacteria bacterium]
MTLYGVFQVFAFVLGLCLGSFLNVCIARMPEDRSVISPRSRCPHCGHPIRAIDNIPLLSWLLLGARCRDCHQPISVAYPLVEASTGLLVLLVFREVVPGPSALDGPHLLAFAWYTLFVTALAGAALVDARHHIVPDEFSLWMIPVGVAGALGLGFLGPDLAPTWKQSLVGAFAGGAFLMAVNAAYWLVRREVGVWPGDVKLLAMIGAFLGAFPALILVLILGSSIGAIVGIGLVLATRHGGLKMALPFGPFLALGGIATLLFGEPVLRRWTEAFLLLLPT